MTKFAVTNVSCINASKSQHPISTGIGYLDHMIDQLNSHAQVGVSVAVVDCLGGGNNNFDDDGNSHQQRHSYEYVNRYANEDQSEITSLVGSALGERLRSLLTSSRTPSSTNVSRFRCPLDEALVECILATSTTNDGGGGNLVDFDLSPYGIYPPEVGRSRVGTLETSHVTTFFADLAESSGLVISLRKIRGDNGHHVIESAFKAFSRALRNLLDGTNAYDDEYDPVKYELAWGGTMGVPQASGGCDDGAMKRRTGNVERSTKETSISVRVLLSDGILAGDDRRTAADGPSIIVDTGIKTLDTFVSTLAREAYMSVDVKCTGDLYVDDHHTSEDVSIALGQALDEALGTRAGLNRMWCAIGAYGYAEVEVTMDLSNRPHIIHDLFKSTTEEYAGDLSVEMLVHALESLATNSKSTVHVVERRVGKCALETFIATAIAYGRALRMCGAVDPRRAGKTASSKGTLSV